MAVPHPIDAKTRLLIAAGLGSVASLATAHWVPWQLSALVGWDVTALFIVVTVAWFLFRLDAPNTAMVATREDDSRHVVDVIVVAASVISIIGVVLGLAHSHHRSGAAAAALTDVSVFTVFLSWVTVHTLFTLRYARLYYADPPGGINFSDPTQPPDYLDFVYFAFTVGMTFQVSDTDVSSRAIRRTTIRHALLSYVFGTIIVGVTINVIGGLIT